MSMQCPKEQTVFFLKKLLVDTFIAMGPLIPLFLTSGDNTSGFQGQSVQSYSHVCLGKGWDQDSGAPAW